LLYDNGKSYFHDVTAAAFPPLVFVAWWTLAVAALRDGGLRLASAENRLSAHRNFAASGGTLALDSHAIQHASHPAVNRAGDREYEREGEENSLSLSLSSGREPASS